MLARWRWLTSPCLLPANCQFQPAWLAVGSWHPYPLQTPSLDISTASFSCNVIPSSKTAACCANYHSTPHFSITQLHTPPLSPAQHPRADHQSVRNPPSLTSTLERATPVPLPTLPFPWVPMRPRAPLTAGRHLSRQECPKTQIYYFLHLFSAHPFLAPPRHPAGVSGTYVSSSALSTQT